MDFDPKFDKAYYTKGSEGVVEDMIEFGHMTHAGAAVWNLLADLEVKLRNDLHTKKG